MKKSKVVFALALLVGMPVLLYGLSLTAEKRYTAQVRLQVNPMGLRTEYPDPYSPINVIANSGRPRSTATQIQVITGTEVLGRAIQRVRDTKPGLLPEQKVSTAYEDLVRRLQVDNDPNSDVVGLRVTQGNPELAAELANSIAYAYQDYVDEQAQKGSQTLMTVLNYQAGQSKKKLDAIDARIATLNQQTKVADPVAEIQAATNELSSLRQQLESTRSQLTGAQADLGAQRAALARMDKNIVSNVQTGPNQVAQTYETQIFQLKNQLADVQSKFSDDFPDVKSLKQQIRRAETDYAKVKKDIQSGKNFSSNPAYQQQVGVVALAQGRADSLRNSVASQERAVAAAQTRLDALPALQQKVIGLQRERAAMEQSYGQFVQRRDAAQAAADSKQSDVTIVSQALVPDAPSFPDPRLFVLAGLAVGGFLAILILMPRQEAPVVGSYYPEVYTPPAPPAPTTGTGTAP